MPPRAKVALVTGAHSGIGAATVREFAKNGWRVLACDVVLDPAQFAHFKEAVESLKLDVREEGRVEEAVALAVRKWGGLDFAFANAGIGGSLAMFPDCESKEMQSVFDVNVMGVFYVLKYSALAMMKQGSGGSLVSTSSVAGLRAGQVGVAYSVSKAAVISLTQNIAQQLAGTNIRVNCICPGVITTPMAKPIFERTTKDHRRLVEALNPMERFGAPEEIASVVFFLASPSSTYVNGQAIAVDGGLSAAHPFVPRRSRKATAKM